MGLLKAAGDIDALYRIPLSTDGPWFFVPVQLGTPPQRFDAMLDTGSSLSWFQTDRCYTSPSLCNISPKFNAELSSSIIFQPETISVRYTEGTIATQLVSDVMVLGSGNSDNNGTIGMITGNNTTLKANNNTVQEESIAGPQPIWPAAVFRGMRTFGLTSDVSGDSFLLTKETHVTGFLGASKGRFESESDFSTHAFLDTVRELPNPVFSLALTDKWGTLTLGGSDPAFYSKPLTWLPTMPGEAGWVTRLFPHIEVLAKDGLSASYPDVDYVQTDLDRVWFDSGTTYIWGDEAAILPLNKWMGADPVTGQVDCATVPSLGKIVFSIGGARADGEPVMRLELTSTEFIVGKPKSHKCFTALNASSNSKNHWIFGLQVLRGYYTVYHYDYSVVGISRYNITNTNPSGKVVIPGSHAALDQDVFCVDLDHSMEEFFYEGTRPTDSRMNRTKSLLRWYINQKSAWNAGHEFAMIILGEKAHMDFTDDVALMSHALDGLYSMGKYNSFDTTSLFHEIQSHAGLAADKNVLIRAILIYTRSDILPTLPDPEVLEDLRKENRFYFDCIYIHNKSSDVVGNVKPQQHVYDRLTEFEDSRSVGYFFELTRLYRKYSGAMAELLANPTFRPIQDEHDFRIPQLPLSQDDEPLVQKVQQRSESAQTLKGGPASSPAQSSTSRISSPFSNGSPVMNMAEQRSSPVRVKAEPASSMPGSSQPRTGGGTGSGGGSVNDAILL
ncbi:MAG: aspartic peptidase domain-containing protein [Podila humilis]|nr:MAG: aspartic peptidase domain-containing protein [Podila humilis]